MNILVVNGDGPEGLGLELLRAAAKQRWGRGDRIVAMVPKQDASGSGMGRKVVDLSKLRPQRKSPDFFVVPSATSVDIVHHAFAARDRYLRTGSWDLVLCGVNAGANVGLGIFGSSTVGAALLAATHYGTCGWAFSQSLEGGKVPKGDRAQRESFRNSARHLRTFLDTTSVLPGECHSVNFPTHDVPKGWIHCLVAPFDPHVGPGYLPAASDVSGFDAALLGDGYVTRSDLVLNFNPPIRY